MCDRMRMIFIFGNNGQWGQSTRTAPMCLDNQQCRGIIPEKRERGIAQKEIERTRRDGQRSRVLQHLLVVLAELVACAPVGCEWGY